MVELEKEEEAIFYKTLNGRKVYITDEDNKKRYVDRNFIDISYSSRESESSVLSNMFPYSFYFQRHIIDSSKNTLERLKHIYSFLRRYKVSSAEGLLQGLKHKKVSLQRQVFKYSGKDAYHIRVASFINDWREDGFLYFNGKKINRFGIEYQQLLNDLYLSLMNNPFFANSLKNTKEKVLLHSDGKLDSSETTLTPREYILRLECMREYLLNMISKKELYEKMDNIALVLSKELSLQKRLY
jgi:hypothetical protein